LTVRLAGENKRQAEHLNEFSKDIYDLNQELARSRERVTRLAERLENCRKLLANQQGIEDSGELNT
jgi:uncharacterized coiled-coil protein SlyX